MSHPFGDLVSQHLHRKHGLSQAKLAEGILQSPTIITAMCKGKRLTGPQARERVLAIIAWLRQQRALDTLDEANALLNAADMAALNASRTDEAALVKVLRPTKDGRAAESSTTVRSHRDNLPTPATALIGREKDVVAAGKLLRRTDVRAITFIGPPGVGKTRLAMELARQVSREYADGACFVALAPINDLNLVPAAIAQALGLTPELNPLEQVKLHVRDKQLLLMLDNFEQLLAAGQVVAEVLAAAPRVKVIVTSRATLNLNGEHLVEVLPLEEQAAVGLFIARAQAIKPAFTLTEANRRDVADICCKRLDGLPLAIELAATRIRLFEPSLLLARLSSRLDFLTFGASWD